MEAREEAQEQLAAVAPMQPVGAPLLFDVLPRVLGFLGPVALANASTTSAEVMQLAEGAWRSTFCYRWSCLFALKRSPASWRASCRMRALARRQDLSIRAGRWNARGLVIDRKGRVTTEALCVFEEDSYAMCGYAEHTRLEPATKLRGSWQGNLCANIVPNGGKRCWCLGWKEKILGCPGGYDYSGALEEEPGGAIFVHGKFTWFGRVRGVFIFVLQHAGSDVREEAWDMDALTGRTERLGTTLTV